jgi:hypothetical protein
MTATSIRKKLIEDIHKASDKDLKEIYRLHNLVVEEKKSGYTWQDLSPQQKEKINKGISELKAGKGIPAIKTIKFLNEKYGIPS